jgi:hypothetical protein
VHRQLLSFLAYLGTHTTALVRAILRTSLKEEPPALTKCKHELHFIRLATGSGLQAHADAFHVKHAELVDMRNQRLGAEQDLAQRPRGRWGGMQPIGEACGTHEWREERVEETCARCRRGGGQADARQAQGSVHVAIYLRSEAMRGKGRTTSPTRTCAASRSPRRRRSNSASWNARTFSGSASDVRGRSCLEP